MANSKPTLHYAAQVVISGLPKPLSYRLEGEFIEIEIGSEVVVPVGGRQTKGWVVNRIPLDLAYKELLEREEKSAASSKTTAEQLSFFARSELSSPETAFKTVYSAAQAFLPEQLRLFEWMAEYYGAPLAEILDNAVPRRGEMRHVVCVQASEKLHSELATDNLFLEKLTKRAPLQGKIISLLATATGPIPITHLEELGSGARASIQALEKRGYLSSDKESIKGLSEFYPGQSLPEPIFAGRKPQNLTAGQKFALEKINGAIKDEGFSAFLLFGVTGSGKTEIYLRAIEEVLSRGGSALMIVPEISLTPQFLDQFQSRLDLPISLLHSQVGISARWDAWDSLLKGHVRVAIGARSAVFAPLRNLSLVIVDEEHESSYKQSEGLRYNARDVAVMRAKYSGCPVILGSATPSFESLVNVQRKRYQLLELPDRATSRPPPAIEIIDLREFKRKEMITENISPPLHQAITENLSRGGQVVILYNKRGFASFLQCSTCSDVIACPNCSVPLTFHKTAAHLLCHLCNLSMFPPTHCPQCRDPKTSRIERAADGSLLEKESKIEQVGKLIQRGAGTEKVVDELHQLFPQAVIRRMDRDTVGKKGAYREILGSMRSGKTDILVGTQMIAKGHDLPGVTLVGIIDSDIGLHIPDFRASERIFQLITQAAGRAGRGEEHGRVLVQTREPKHPTIVALASGRFKAFARYELEFRKSLNYPPIGRMLRLVISCPDAQEACNAATFVRSVLDRIVEELPAGDNPNFSRPVILGPAPSAYQRLRGRYRWHILVKSNSARDISQLANTLNSWKGSVRQFDDFRLTIDVDPMDML